MMKAQKVQPYADRSVYHYPNELLPRRRAEEQEEESVVLVVVLRKGSMESKYLSWPSPVVDI